MRNFRIPLVALYNAIEENSSSNQNQFDNAYQIMYTAIQILDVEVEVEVEVDSSSNYVYCNPNT